MGGFYFLLAIIIFGIVFFKDRGMTKDQKLRTEEWKKANAEDAGLGFSTREQVPSKEILEKYLQAWLRNKDTANIHPSLDKYIPYSIRKNILYAYENDLGYVNLDVSYDKWAESTYHTDPNCIFRLFYLVMCKEANKNPYKDSYKYNNTTYRHEYITVDEMINETVEEIKYKYGTKGVVKKYK